MHRTASFRPEIQALRAFAVLAVVLYHLWPGRLPGGYIGVDVFFVISGFLITGHLLREVRATGGIALRKFWARRIRRLLPASFVVLLATSLAVLFIVPRGIWQQFFREIGGSALYVENWILAGDSVDYLAADNIPSPVQHFWSLGVEEQLYVALPIVMVIVLLAARKLRVVVATNRLLGLTLAAIVAGSFALSSLAVVSEDPSAYFATTGRAWEFAAGGLLAWWGSSLAEGPRLAASASWGGWLGLTALLFVYDDTTLFPGAGALLPVVFTLLVLWAGSPVGRLSPTFITGLAPIQRIGDVSYSMYLWHWPILILVPFATESDLTTFQKAMIFAVTVGLAFLSKRFIEDPYRTGRRSRNREVRAFTFAAAGMAVIVALCGGVVFTVQASIAQSTARAEQMIDDIPLCFGASAMSSDACDKKTRKKSTNFVPLVEAALDDKGEIYDEECRSQLGDDSVRTCTYGEPGGRRVALIGDSHAASWFPAVKILAEKEGWELHTFYKSACAFSLADRQGDRREFVESCLAWNRGLQSELASQDPYDLVFTSHAAIGFLGDDGEKSRQAGIDGFTNAWKPLEERGTRIIAIRDTPRPGPEGAQCVLENSADPNACTFPLKDAYPAEDLSVAAAEATPGTESIDLSEYFCENDVCPLVVGGVLVYRDSHHFTATYSASLAPFLLKKTVEAENRF